MKERLDLLLVNRGLAPSREKAKTMIMEGNVFVENDRRGQCPRGVPVPKRHDKIKNVMI